MRYPLLLVLPLLWCVGCSESGTGTSTVHTDGAVPFSTRHTTFEFHSHDELVAFFEQHQYGPDYWQQGDRTVPRLYLTHIPPRWGQTVAPHLTVQEKKRGFFFTLAPLVLAANETVAQERDQLAALLAVAPDVWSDEQSQWLQALAKRYSVDGDLSDAATQQELTRRVDVIPTSLVLAQAAVESGWGTSRFASEGNALFGQWTWSDEGITPAEQRTESKGNYKIRAFDTPKQSVRAYLHNLNTGHAYADLRKHRRLMRKQNKPLDGIDMAEGLLRYSERGQAYIDELRALIRYNKLQPTDTATLRDMEPVWLVPVGEGAG